MAEEAKFADDYMPAYGILRARAADLSAVLRGYAPDAYPFHPDPIIAAIEANDMATAAVGRAART